MFERYTEAAKRVMYFSAIFSLFEKAPRVDVDHLLYGLATTDDRRAQRLFRLGSILKSYRDFPSKAIVCTAYSKISDMKLTPAACLVFTRANTEANQMDDYWVGTEHLLLGVLGDPDCKVTRIFAGAGITLDNARLIVEENKQSRAPDGPVVRLGEKPLLIERISFGWRTWKFNLKTKLNPRIR